PFPTEQDNAIGEYIRVKGHEYGTTTGRPRRCGWFDGVAAAYSIRIGSVDSVALMHLDTLTGIQELQVCRAYSIDGKETTFFPSNIDRLARAKPVYETLSGWDEDLGNATSFASLPVAAQRYVRRIEQILGKPVEMIGVGPKRSQTILK
ncbi:MAG TPA: adenylosuccinate synthetase, partial [Sedimentisphaerales bacterium]|nr:adenylosuccinate synthetase [Sedimentisphaerales bacterium]